jgi:hypothetical protein
MINLFVTIILGATSVFIIFFVISAIIRIVQYLQTDIKETETWKKNHRGME